MPLIKTPVFKRIFRAEEESYCSKLILTKEKVEFFVKKKTIKIINNSTENMSKRIEIIK